MSEPMTPDEFATWQDDMRSCRGPSEEEIRADERRKVAEEIAAEIERVVISGDFERPKYERGGFLNDARWAARIAREIGEAHDAR